MLNVDLVDSETAPASTAGSIIENVLLVGLLAGAANMGKFLAETLTANMSIIYKKNSLSGNPTFLAQPYDNNKNNNPFDTPSHGQSNLQKYNQPNQSRWG